MKIMTKVTKGHAKAPIKLKPKIAGRTSKTSLGVVVVSVLMSQTLQITAIAANSSAKNISVIIKYHIIVKIFKLLNEWSRWESNPRPSECKSDALAKLSYGPKLLTKV